MRRELSLVGRSAQLLSSSRISALASTNNLSSADKFRVRYGLEDCGATITFTKNTLKAKALEQLPPEAMGLAPLFRGKTILAIGPAEVSMAKQLLRPTRALRGRMACEGVMAPALRTETRQLSSASTKRCWRWAVSR